MLLAGDIGGTKTVLGLYTAERGARKAIAEERFSSTKYPSLKAVIAKFLSGRDVQLKHAAFGVAGPVIGGRAQVTNLDWVVDEDLLAEALNVPQVSLLNDLQSIANAVPYLGQEDLVTLNQGNPEPHGPIAVIAPGTGLGEAFLVFEGTRYTAYPSEGGHTDFAPTTPIELDLLTYLQSRFDHVSYERVCSGKGLPNLYDFLKDSGRFQEPDWLRDQLAGAEDRTPIIVNAASEDRSEIAEATLDLFVSILGSEAGNLALKVLATGGVYIAGGIPPRILPELRKPTFLKTFLQKGRFSDLLSSMPVYVILNARAALIGTAYYGLRMLI